MKIITQYGAQWDTIRDILQKHCGILTSASGIAQIVGETPKMVVRRARNVGDTLICSEFTKTMETTWLSQYPRSKGMFPYRHCQVATFHDSKMKQSFQIRDLINCTTIELFTCYHVPVKKSISGKPKTKRQLRISLMEHMREIAEKNSEKPLARHFTLFHNGSLEGMSIYSINLPPRRGDFDQILLQKEKWWIFRLSTLRPKQLIEFPAFLET